MAVSAEDMARPLPRHIAIIMDGNGRWARARGLPRSEGHRAGADAARAIVEECRRLGIPYLTLYAFSSENWKRPKPEISAIFSLLLEFLKAETPRLIKEGVRLNVMGDMEGLPAPLRAALALAVASTARGCDMRLNLALNYGGRAEIVRAARLLIEAGTAPDKVTEEAFAQCLYTAGQPDPDLLIRASGEKRLSNFLLYQCAYSEFYFTPTLWPDFSVQELRLALDDFAGRSRRFGAAQETPLNREEANGG